jgi:hypothetical protein
MSDTAPAAADLAAGVGAVLRPVYDRLAAIAAAVAASRAAARDAWTESQMGDIQRTVLALIEEDDVHVGMGFVGAPGVVDGLERSMLWWQRTEGRVSRLRLNFDQTSIDVYDYVEMDWFRLPSEGRERVTMGPYVDYAGSELYILTTSVPVVVDGEFLGIAGSDLLFGEVERRLIDVLRTSPAEAVIVNAERRVVAVNSARWVVGGRVPALPEVGDGAEWAEVGEVAECPGWRVALAT